MVELRKEGMKLTVSENEIGLRKKKLRKLELQRRWRNLKDLLKLGQWKPWEFQRKS